MSASSPVPADHPLMIAWEAYRSTDDYKNSKHWALTIAPMIQSGDPDAERKRYALMPVEQREQHIEGSLWAAFERGFAAARTTGAPALERCRRVLDLVNQSAVTFEHDELAISANVVAEVVAVLNETAALSQPAAPRHEIEGERGWKRLVDPLGHEACG